MKNGMVGDSGNRIQYDLRFIQMSSRVLLIHSLCFKKLLRPKCQRSGDSKFERSISIFQHSRHPCQKTRYLRSS